MKGSESGSERTIVYPWMSTKFCYCQVISAEDYGKKVKMLKQKVKSHNDSTESHNDSTKSHNDSTKSQCDSTESLCDLAESLNDFVVSTILYILFFSLPPQFSVSSFLDNMNAEARSFKS